MNRQQGRTFPNYPEPPQNDDEFDDEDLPPVPDEDEIMEALRMRSNQNPGNHSAQNEPENNDFDEDDEPPPPAPDEDEIMEALRMRGNPVSAVANDNPPDEEFDEDELPPPPDEDEVNEALRLLEQSRAQKESVHVTKPPEPPKVRVEKRKEEPPVEKASEPPKGRSVRCGKDGTFDPRNKVYNDYYVYQSRESARKAVRRKNKNVPEHRPIIKGFEEPAETSEPKRKTKQNTFGRPVLATNLFPEVRNEKREGYGNPIDYDYCEDCSVSETKNAEIPNLCFMEPHKFPVTHCSPYPDTSEELTCDCLATKHTDSLFVLDVTDYRIDLPYEDLAAHLLSPVSSPAMFQESSAATDIPAKATDLQPQKSVPKSQTPPKRNPVSAEKRQMPPKRQQIRKVQQKYQAIRPHNVQQPPMEHKTAPIVLIEQEKKAVVEPPMEEPKTSPSPSRESHKINLPPPPPLVVEPPKEEPKAASVKVEPPKVEINVVPVKVEPPKVEIKVQVSQAPKEQQQKTQISHPPKLQSPPMYKKHQMGPVKKVQMPPKIQSPVQAKRPASGSHPPVKCQPGRKLPPTPKSSYKFQIPPLPPPPPRKQEDEEPKSAPQPSSQPPQPLQQKPAEEKHVQEPPKALAPKQPVQGPIKKQVLRPKSQTPIKKQPVNKIQTRTPLSSPPSSVAASGPSAPEPPKQQQQPQPVKTFQFVPPPPPPSPPPEPPKQAPQPVPPPEPPKQPEEEKKLVVPTPVKKQIMRPKRQVAPRIPRSPSPTNKLQQPPKLQVPQNVPPPEPTVQAPEPPKQPEEENKPVVPAPVKKQAMYPKRQMMPRKVHSPTPANKLQQPPSLSVPPQAGPSAEPSDKPGSEEEKKVDAPAPVKKQILRPKHQMIPRRTISPSSGNKLQQPPKAQAPQNVPPPEPKVQAPEPPKMAGNEEKKVEAPVPVKKQIMRPKHQMYRYHEGPSNKMQQPPKLQIP